MCAHMRYVHYVCTSDGLCIMLARPVGCALRVHMMGCVHCVCTPDGLCTTLAHRMVYGPGLKLQA